MEYPLYFTAFYKHEEPQHLVDGPFLSWSEARERIDSGRSVARCIVKTTLPFEECAEPE